MRVLIVEDEPYLAEAVRDGLRLEAIAADIAGDGNTALELLSVNSYDLAVLDRDVPWPFGDEIARRSSPPAAASRSSCSPLPTGSTTRRPGSSRRRRATSQTVRVPRARHAAEALHRRRAHPAPGQRDRGPAAGPPSAGRSFATDATSRSPAKQFAIASSPNRRQGGDRQRRELLERAWDRPANPFTNAVRITVSASRKRLGEPWLIATVPGVGYRIDTGVDATHPGGTHE